jgi:DNA polymerase
MDRALTAELREALASARAQLREWSEEGLDVYVYDPSPPPRQPAAAPTLDSVRAELGECTRCRLAAGRSRIVFGDGDPDADLLFVGEGPGEQEDRQGLPFVGRAGELLTQMIERGLRIPRSSVYICNIVKCRPPQNRTPLPDEVAACRPFLDGQIDAVRPKVIVALGKPATSLLLGRDVSITRVRGTWQDYRGFPVMPTFHPAFLLRQYTEENRRLVWEDLKGALVRARELGGRFPARD